MFGLLHTKGNEKMDIIENEQLSPIEAVKHWYYHSKYKLMQAQLTNFGLDPTTLTIADVGTGIGLFLNMLEADGLASPDRSIGIDPAHVNPAVAVGTSIPLVPYFPKDRQYDVILMMDVLEHVDDDISLLNDTVEHIEHGGYLFVTVPALPFLESAHDRFLGHYRRYTLSSLRQLIEKCPALKLINAHYYFASLLPVAIPWRLLNKRKSTIASDMKSIPRLFNSMMKAICGLELQLASYNKFAGLTAVAICQKIS